MQNMKLIQGGMGVKISQYTLARTVAKTGNGRAGGTVSLTMIAHVARSRLVKNDIDQLRALDLFGSFFPEVAQLIRHAFVENRKVLPAYNLDPPVLLRWMTLFGSFAEFYLASEGHDHPVGANVLYKVGYPHLDTLVGLMMAVALRKPTAISYLIVGAGLPGDFPHMMQELVTERRTTFLHDVENSKVGQYMVLDLEVLTSKMGEVAKASTRDPALFRIPLFLPIVTMQSAVEGLRRMTSGFEGIDGFIVENKDAGGHNANPRNKTEYGPKDEMDFDKLRRLTSLPYWLAGGWLPRFQEARELGAVGIQVGGPFSLTPESGTLARLRDATLEKIRNDTLVVESTNMSPTNYRFQVVQHENTMSDPNALKKPGCTKCYLRTPVLVLEEGSYVVRYECTGDPLYKQRGGTKDDTDKACLCNGLAATSDVLDEEEAKHIPPIQTGGTFLARDTRYVWQVTGTGTPGRPMQAADVVRAVLAQTEA